MPSSTEHDTEQEFEIFEHFTLAFARLFHADCHPLINELADVFSILMDADSQKLLDASYKTDFFSIARTYCVGLLRSAVVYEASKAVMDTAWMLLKQYGREGDSVECFRFADDIRLIAWHITLREKADADAAAAAREEYERIKMARRDRT